MDQKYTVYSLPHPAVKVRSHRMFCGALRCGSVRCARIRCERTFKQTVWVRDDFRGAVKAKNHRSCMQQKVWPFIVAWLGNY